LRFIRQPKTGGIDDPSGGGVNINRNKNSNLSYESALCIKYRVFFLHSWGKLLSPSFRPILVEGCNWILESEQRSVCQSDLVANMEDLFRSVEGQYLVSAQCSHEANSCTLEFDMGARLTLWPRHGGEPDEDQWTLHYNDGSSMAYTNSGSFSFEVRKDDGQT
jgi:hypothetical protein